MYKMYRYVEKLCTNITVSLLEHGSSKKGPTFEWDCVLAAVTFWSNGAFLRVKTQYLGYRCPTYNVLYK